LLLFVVVVVVIAVVVVPLFLIKSSPPLDRPAIRQNDIQNLDKSSLILRLLARRYNSSLVEK
jgi:hypothetical protein